MPVNSIIPQKSKLPGEEKENFSVDESLNRILNETELSKPGTDFFFIIESKRFIRIRFSDIVSIEANRSYLNIQTKTARHLIVGSLTQLEKKLPATVFCRVHRAWIIPVDGISTINKERIMVNDKWYPLGHLYRRRLIKQLLPYVFNRRFLDDME